jgi:hypothetical protein
MADDCETSIVDRDSVHIVDLCTHEVSENRCLRREQFAPHGIPECFGADTASSDGGCWQHSTLPALREAILPLDDSHSFA